MTDGMTSPHKFDNHSRRLLLRGGLIADGIGTHIRRADVLLDGARIAWIGKADADVGDHDTVTLAPGSIICPGFIDAHVHAEAQLLAAGRVDAALAQGVTTLIVGQDGTSWIGAEPNTIEYLNRYYAAVNSPIRTDQAMSVANFAECVRGRLSQNVAVLASHGTIRYNVGGREQGPLTLPQRAAARTQMEKSLADGAVGLSTGFDYLPSSYGDIHEIAELAHPLVEADRPYVSHMRGNGPRARAGLTELLTVGRLASVRVHASHLWGDPSVISDAYQTAARQGVQLSHDMYPYRRSSTILAASLLPQELQAGGPDATLARLTEPATRAKLQAAPQLSNAVLDSLILSCVPEGYAQDAGLSVTAAASRRGKSPQEWIIDLLLDARLVVGAHRDRPLLSGDNLRWILSHKQHAAGSDGIYLGQHPHPRGYGTFARLARHYLELDPELGHQLLARHAATTAAEIYGLTTRGRLAPGLAADIVVIGPSGLYEEASDDQPTRLARGVDLVFVNGSIVWQSGKPVANCRPGMLVSN